MNQFLSGKWLNELRIALGVFLILTFSSIWYVSVQNGYDNQYITYAAELRVLFERFVRHAGESATEAKPNAFTYLKYRTNEFSAILDILKRGKQDYSGKLVLPPSPRSIQNKELAELSRMWGTEKADANIILDNQSLLINLNSSVKTLSESLQKIQQNYIDILGASKKRINSPDVFEEIAKQIYTAESIQNIIYGITNNDVDVGVFENQLPKKVEAFAVGLASLKTRFQNDVILPKLLDIEKDFAVIKQQTDDIRQTAKTLVSIFAAWNRIYAMIPRFLDATTNLEKAYSNLSSQRFVNSTTATFLSIITFLLLGIVLFLMYKKNIADLKQSEDETRKLQSDIQRLVNELKDLANGNLAVFATPGTGVTAAVADAINYAINALRNLVSSINHTSQKVSDSASQVKRITKDLNKAITQQSEQILNTGASVSLMATSIDRVSQNAKKSAEVAENSVNIAHEGATVVNNTIAGMERLREQILETEKRIQRLSESSQEIVDIVALIDGIAEQTNILSLNASIQAAMAGDVGMGFAVVADEVQQLAVKSSQAAKDVENVVKTIRTDTSRAVESMERAITEVNTGTLLANSAGLALEKIETVSKSLSELTHGISITADEQALMSNKINKMMDVIESIAKQTATGTDTTAESVATLDALVQELHASVSEFKLPEPTYGQR